MTPSIINRKVWPTSISIVISLPPSSVQFHLQHVRLFYKCEGAQEWTQAEVHAMPKETVFIHNLLHGKHYTIKAVAVYPNNEEIDSQEMPCEMPTGGQLYAAVFFTAYTMLELFAFEIFRYM